MNRPEAITTEQAIIESGRCKICGHPELVEIAHTACCRNCGVLLYYPYPMASEPCFINKDAAYAWYGASAAFNHVNFTRMLRYATSGQPVMAPLSILDFGGGGGQFALICKSHFPRATVYLLDINNDSALKEWSPLNLRLQFDAFAADTTRFDFIFLNDVFEHLDDPVTTLQLLAGKLKPGGKIFIDTPRQFWIYPLTRVLSRHLHLKLLKGTVSPAHLQIWSSKSFDIAVRRAGLRIEKMTTWAEFTLPYEYYLTNMGITHPAVRFAGRVMYAAARFILRNKIVCVLTIPEAKPA